MREKSTGSPNHFIIFGAPKCGTTSLSEYLRDNPTVYVTDPKELHYFCDDLNVPGRVSDKNEYLRHFSSIGESAITAGEASPLYLISRTAAKNARALFPEARIVVMLRSTPEFLLSYYQHLYYLGDENSKIFEEAWFAQTDRKSGKQNYPIGCSEPKRLDYHWVGQLGRHVERLLNHFPADQVKFIFFEDLKVNPRKIYMDTIEFIGGVDDGRIEFPHININKRHKIRFLSLLPLYVPQYAIGAFKRFKHFVGMKDFSFTQQLLKINTEIGKGASLDKATRDFLINEFRDDISLLSKLTGRNLDHWL